MVHTAGLCVPLSCANVEACIMSWPSACSQGGTSYCCAAPTLGFVTWPTRTAGSDRSKFNCTMCNITSRHSAASCLSVCQMHCSQRTIISLACHFHEFFSNLQTKGTKHLNSNYQHSYFYRTAWVSWTRSIVNTPTHHSHLLNFSYPPQLSPSNFCQFNLQD